MNIFGRNLDIESIELWFIEPDGDPQFGVSILDDAECPSYNDKSKALRFSMRTKNFGESYIHEYIIQEKNGEFHYRELESQRYGEEPYTGHLELFEGETGIILYDHGDGDYKYYFHIAKMP